MQVRQRDSLRIAPTAFWLILPPLAVFAAGDILQLWIGWHEKVPIPGVDGSDQWMRKEAEGRVTMMAAFMTAVAVGLAAVFLYASDLLRLFGSVTRRRLLGASAIALLLLAGWVGAMYRLLPDILHYPGWNFVASVLKQANSDLPDKLSTINMIVRVVFVLGGIGVIVGTISCLAEPVRSRPPWTRQALRRLQRRRLRRYLNLAAAVMTTGLLFMVAWMRWPAFAYTGGAHAAYIGHINALALYFGVYYSVIIASYYVPIAAILQSREASALLGKDAPPSDDSIADWRSMDLAGKGLVTLVPALAGIMPSLLELLRSGGG